MLLRRFSTDELANWCLFTLESYSKYCCHWSECTQINILLLYITDTDIRMKRLPLFVWHWACSVYIGVWYSQHLKIERRARFNQIGWNTLTYSYCEATVVRFVSSSVNFTRTDATKSAGYRLKRIERNVFAKKYYVCMCVLGIAYSIRNLTGIAWATYSGRSLLTV